MLNLLPSGILRPNVVCVMGNGMVIDPHHLDGEINKLREQGIDISPANLKISDRATITMPYHVAEDGWKKPVWPKPAHSSAPPSAASPTLTATST